MLKIENAKGTVLAYLNNLEEATVKEVLNGEYTLSFVATIDHLKTDYLYDENNLINYENDLFRPSKIEEIHDEDDALTVEVECEHISYDLINNVMDNFSYTYSSAASVMASCLQGTDFNLRNCDIIEKTAIQYTEECNSKQISIAIANNWHGELKYYRHYIDLVKSRGQNRGTGFIFGKNLKSVKRIINRADNTTSYEVEIVEGTGIDELGYYELGDTVRVIDERLNVDYYCKIIEIEKDVLTGLNSNVVLGDVIKDMRSTFSSVKRDVQEVKDTVTAGSVNWNKVSQIVNNSGDIVLGKLNTLTNIATKIVNSTGTFAQLDNCLYWHDQPTEESSTFATKWGAQGLVFANSKDANGDWVWQTALDADGLVATSLTSSCLNTVTANVINLVVDSLTGKTISGCTFLGGQIWIGETVPTNGDTSNYTGMLINNKGVIQGYKNGVQTYTLTHSAEGKLILRDGSQYLYMDSSDSVIYSVGSSLKLMGGMPSYSSTGILESSNIEIEDSGGDIYITANKGKGTIYLNGNVVVSGSLEY